MKVYAIGDLPDETIQTMLSIDPGKNQGWGYFEGDLLLDAGKGEIPELFDRIVKQVVIEAPRWYPKEREVDVNDLLDLSIKVGDLQGHYRSLDVVENIELVYPRNWKGTLRWDICCDRVLAALTEKECGVLPRRPRKKDVDHNVLDAVGLGLWKLGRFG